MEVMEVIFFTACFTFRRSVLHSQKLRFYGNDGKFRQKKSMLESLIKNTAGV